jgi:hypothetical protein
VLAFHSCFWPHSPQNVSPSGSLAPQFEQNDPEGFGVASLFLVDTGLVVRRLETMNTIATATATMRTTTTIGSVYFANGCSFDVLVDMLVDMLLLDIELITAEVIAADEVDAIVELVALEDAVAEDAVVDGVETL